MYQFEAQSKHYCFILVVAVAFAWPVSGRAMVRHVPVPYTTIASAASAAEDGDIIEIEAGEYTGTGIVATWPDSNLTVRGVNGRAHLNASGVTISNGKAIFLTTGDNITIENIEFSNAAVPDENGAGIRHEGSLLTVRNCYFHDNQNGLLTSNSGNGEVVVENSEFNHNGLGSAGYTHNMYIGHIARFTLQFSYSHHATHGHNVKTRATENHVLYNRIMDETTGIASYQIDVPNGGLTYIVGNVVHQGTNAENSRLLSYAAEGATNPIQEVYVSGNTFVNDRSSAIGVRLSGTPKARIVNNIFDNIVTPVEGVATAFEGNIVGNDNYFAARNIFDFHLTADSPAINVAVAPGTGNDADLTPIYEYVHPSLSKDRVTDNNLDVGAFEYSNQMVVPGDINGNGTLELNDALIALLVTAGYEPVSAIYSAADVDQDGVIGLTEALFVMRNLAAIQSKAIQ